MISVSEHLAHLCRQTDLGLWRARCQIPETKSSNVCTGHLLFPKYREQRGGSIRVSEQEARFAFVEAVCRSTLRYSVEAPTNKMYQFTGSRPISAQTDLSLHGADGHRICNVEFKAKGLSPAREKQFAIFKDMQKLLREPQWGLWFHLLERSNSQTISNLLKVMENAIMRVRAEFANDIDTPGITIHICVLEQGFSFHRDLLGLDNDESAIARLVECFQINYKVCQSRLQPFTLSNGWFLHEKSEQPCN